MIIMALSSRSVRNWVLLNVWGYRNTLLTLRVAVETTKNFKVEKRCGFD